MAKYSELVIDNVVGDIWDKEAIHNEQLPQIILDHIYPVGSIYMSADDTFDPNETWGGTWDKVEAGRVIVAAGLNNFGQTGGAATHKLTPAECAVPIHLHSYLKPATATSGHALTVNQIPAHTHGSKALTGSFTVRKWGNGEQVNYVGGIVTVADDTHTGYANQEKSGSVPKLQKVSINATHTHATVGEGASHSHNLLFSSANTGNASKNADAAFSLMQPYIAYNIWYRIA